MPLPGMHDPCKVFCDRAAIAQNLIRDRSDIRVVAAVNPFAPGHSLIIPTDAYNSVADYVTAAPETSSVGVTLVAIVNATGAEWGWPVGVLEHGGNFTQNVPHGHLQVYHARRANGVIGARLQDTIHAPNHEVFEGTILDFARGEFTKLDPRFGYLAVGHFDGPVESLPTLKFYDPSGFGAGNRQPGILRWFAAGLIGRPYLAKAGQIPPEHKAMVDGWTVETKQKLTPHLTS